MRPEAHHGNINFPDGLNLAPRKIDYFPESPAHRKKYLRPSPPFHHRETGSGAGNSYLPRFFRFGASNETSADFPVCMGLQEKRPIQMNRIPRPPIPHFVPSLHLTSAPWPPPSSNFLAGAAALNRSGAARPPLSRPPLLVVSHLHHRRPGQPASATDAHL